MNMFGNNAPSGFIIVHLLASLYCGIYPAPAKCNRL